MTSKTIAVILQAVTGPYQAAMARASGVTQQFGAAARTAGGQVGNVASSTGMLNAKLIGAGGTAFLMKKSVDAAMAFESSFAGVRKTVDASEAEFAALSDGMRDMATQIPVNVNELNRIGEAAGQLGIETDNILEFTRVMADLGVTTNLSSDQAATQLARLANITQMSQDDFGRLGSTIVDLGNNFETTEAEIVEMGMRLAGAGAQVGMTEADILGLATALTSVGIRAEAGGSALSKVMIEIASEVENSGDKLDQFAEVAGMSASEFRRAWQEDATGALVAFITGLGETEGSGRSTLQVLEDLEITEVRMRDALLRTSGAGDDLAEAIQSSNRAWEENNALTKEAEQRYETTESKIQVAKNAFNDLAIELGETLLPAVGEAAEGLTRFLDFDITLPGTRGFSLDPSSAISGAFQDIFQGPGASHMQAMGEHVDALNSKLTTFHKDLTTMTKGQQADADRLQGLADAFVRVGEDADGSTGGVDAFARAQENATNWVENANGEIEHQIDLFRDQYADPVFNLVDAVNSLSAAQVNYNEALSSGEMEAAEQASREVFDALMDVQIATDMAEGKFGNVNARLEEMREAGLLTTEQVDMLKGMIGEARVESEQWTRTYGPTFQVNDSQLDALIEKLRTAGRLISQVSRSHGVVVSTTGGPGGITERAAGGPFDPNELMLVGEKGPEFVRFGQAGTVIDADQTRQMLAAPPSHMPSSGVFAPPPAAVSSSGRGPTFNFNGAVLGTPQELRAMVQDAIRNYERNNGRTGL